MKDRWRTFNDLTEIKFRGSNVRGLIKEEDGFYYLYYSKGGELLKINDYAYKNIVSAKTAAKKFLLKLIREVDNKR